jgi:hypothetical protein
MRGDVFGAVCVARLMMQKRVPPSQTNPASNRLPNGENLRRRFNCPDGKL